MICPRCTQTMEPGIALGQTWVKGSDNWGDNAYTVYAGGPGYLMNCLKCPGCGYSVTPEDV